MSSNVKTPSQSNIHVLHGENTVLSRKELYVLISSAKERGASIVRIDGGTIQLSDMQNQLGSTSLFGDERVLVVEKLWSQKSATKKTALISEIANATIPCILWHDKTIPATQLKPFIARKASISLFKSSPEVYKTMEMLGTADKRSLMASLQKSIEHDSAEYVFIMCIRQISMLLLAKSGQPIPGAPFVAQKARQQAKKFTLNILLDLHRQLVEMDRRLKTSTNALSLEQFLNIWALKTSTT